MSIPGMNGPEMYKPDGTINTAMNFLSLDIQLRDEKGRPINPDTYYDLKPKSSLKIDVTNDFNEDI